MPVLVEFLLSLVPVALGAALQPPQILALIVLLQTRRSLANGLAFVGSMTLFHLALGILFWILITGVERTVEAEGGRFDLIVGAALVVLGLVLLIYALRRAVSVPAEDAAVSAWLEQLQGVLPGQAALIGIAFLALDPKDWLFTLSAVDLIAAADLGGLANVLVYLLYVFFVQSLLWALLILRLVIPKQAQRYLGMFGAWLERHVRAIEIVVAILIGGYFIYAGLGFLGLF